MGLCFKALEQRQEKNKDDFQVPYWSPTIRRQMTLSRHTAAPWRGNVQSGGMCEKPRGKEVWGLRAGDLPCDSTRPGRTYPWCICTRMVCTHTTVAPGCPAPVSSSVTRWRPLNLHPAGGDTCWEVGGRVASGQSSDLETEALFLRGPGKTLGCLVSGCLISGAKED